MFRRKKNGEDLTPRPTPKLKCHP